jgi:phage terminase small subunit
MAKTEQKPQKMTEKQKAFCDFYLQSFNGTQSAIKAGYSEETAQQIASENLSKPLIQDYIKERTQEASNKRIADITELKEFWTNALRGAEEKADFKDQLKASELLGKAEALFVERLKHEGTISISGELSKARERLGT